MLDLTEEQLNQQRAELDDLMEKKVIMKQKYFPEHPRDAPDRAYRRPWSLTSSGKSIFGIEIPYFF